VSPDPVARLAVVGIGNTLAGDDGAGIRAVEMLRDRLGDAASDGILLLTLEGDLLSVADMLDQADGFIFLDAVAGTPPGRIVRSSSACRAFAPSFHQTDIGTLMARLSTLGLREPFPGWEIRGVTIDPPVFLGEGLSPEVEAALSSLVEDLAAEILGS
jgi:hydrogenase maturation protease